MDCTGPDGCGDRLQPAAVTGSSKIIGYISFVVSILLLIAYRAPFPVWEQL
jgi:hypothetical protein